MSCACGYSRASYSHRLKRGVCGRCYFGSISQDELDESIRAWGRRDLAQQIRGAARQLGHDPRAEQLKDLAFDIEFAGNDVAAVGPLREARAIGLKVSA